MSPPTLIAALVNLNKRPYYIHWGVIQISAGNAVIIVIMTLLFFGAMLIPFPKDRAR